MNATTPIPLVLIGGKSTLAARPLTLLRAPDDHLQTFEDGYRKQWAFVGKLAFLDEVEFVGNHGADQFGPMCQFRLLAPCGSAQKGDVFIGHMHHFDARMDYSREHHPQYESLWVAAMTKLGY